jgi:hypothetical protein
LETPEAREWAKVYNMLYSFGDDALVMNGIHENLLSVKFHDVHMGKTHACLDWLVWGDTLLTYTARTQKYNLMVRGGNEGI